MWLNVVVLDRDYVVNGQSISIDNALQVHAKGLDRNTIFSGALQFFVCELEFGNGAPVCGRYENIRRGIAKPDTVAIEVPAIVVVKTKAVLIVSGKPGILLRKEEHVARFGYDSSCDIPRRSRRVVSVSHVASRYIFLMQASRTW